MAPQRPVSFADGQMAQPSLDAPEPEYHALLGQYCDLRRRGFSQTKLQLKRHQPSLLLAEATRRGMSGSQENRSNAVAEWLRACFDAGIGISAIRRMSALTERGIKQRLKRARDAASGNPPSGLIILLALRLGRGTRPVGDKSGEVAYLTDAVAWQEQTNQLPEIQPAVGRSPQSEVVQVQTVDVDVGANGVHCTKS